MSTKVLHGEGKPRIVIDETAIYTGTIDSRSGHVFTLTGTPVLTANVIDRMLVSLNSSDEATIGKITAYNSTNYTVTVESFSNLFPADTKAATIEDKVIDLPYCESLEEQIEIVMKPPKTLYHNKKKIREIEGFYYYTALNYSSFADLNLISKLQDIYDSARAKNFTFYPRLDNMMVSYLCEVDPEYPINFAQLKYHQGHRGVIFGFEGVEMLTKAPLSSNLNELISNQVIMDDSASVS